MADLPVGTLSMLFSDIEGSTVLLHRLGSRWGEALSAQRGLLRAAFEANGGTEMGTEGDSFFVVFASAHEAVSAAVDGQRALQSHEWPGTGDVRVRMGIHTGEPQRHEDGYIGVDVHRAARIAATAHGGQVVISGATQQLVADLDDVKFRDLGRHRLKDLEATEHLYDVVAPGLLADFGALRTLGKPAALPTSATPLIGRAEDLTAIRARFHVPETRLVTLTGPGGSGKTRLAVAVAADMDRAFVDGVYFVGLQTARDADVMWVNIAEAVDASGDPNISPVDRVGGYLSQRQALLVLDNLEQVTDADHVVGALLSVAPRIRILATSRRPLHLVGENEYPAAPLAVPPPEAASDPDAVAGCSAVEMFVRHAQMVRPSFRLTDANSADVVALCRRLDGLPLAIELAAARSRLLSPRALLDRIDDQLGTGVTGADRPDRQRTLGATIGWSYDLLESPAQEVFRRLGVFSGSVDLEAISAVAGDGIGDPLDTIGHLVDANLVYVTEGADGEPHAALLETIREFARDRLNASGEADDVRLRHLRWCIDTVERTNRLMRGPQHMAALDQMAVVESDVREALRWSLRPADEAGEAIVEAGHELLGLMTAYWYRFGYVAEARFWQERGVATSDGTDTAANVTLLHGIGVSMLQQGEVADSEAAFERALQMARRLGHREFEARGLNDLGIVNRQTGKPAEALRLLQSSLELAREIDNPTRLASALSNLVVVSIDLHEYEQAAEYAHESMATNERNGDMWGLAIDRLNYTAAILHSEGPPAALDHYTEWAEDIASFGDSELTVDLVELGACIHAGMRHPELTARLLGSADMQRTRIALRRSPADQAMLDEWSAPARATADPSSWDDAYADGQELSPEAAIADSISTRSPSGSGHSVVQ